MVEINVITKISLETNSDLRKIAYSSRKRLTDLYREALEEYAENHQVSATSAKE
jgi:hypothetical protein